VLVVLKLKTVYRTPAPSGHEGIGVKKQIRILHLEDAAADVAILNHELRKAGLHFCSKRVETKQDFLNELETHRPDLILSDHGLPCFDGFTALALAKEKCPDVPFIFVTNSLGEETAIETFEGGATDYVLKSNLGKLVPAVERALGQAEERAATKQKEEELHQNEQRLRMLVEGVKDYAITMLDPRGHIASWSVGAQELHGLDAAQALGRPFSIFYTREDIARGRPAASLRQAIAGGRFEEEGRRAGKQGTTFWANVAITPLHDSAGRLTGFSHVIRNITERVQAQEALQKSEALKGAILEAALDGIVAIDAHGLIQEWNPAAQRIFGYSRAQAIGRSMDELVVPSSLQRAYGEGLTHYLITGVGSLLGRPIELSLRRADGTEFSAELSISRFRSKEPSRCTALIRDITKRKQDEAALRDSEQRFRMLVEGVADYAIYMLDPQGRVTTWNSGAETIEGYTAEEILGQHFSRVFLPEDVQAAKPEKLLAQATAEGHAVNEGWRMRKGGGRYWVQMVLTALRDESGTLYGFSKISRDVTAQKEAEEEIRRLNADLEARVQKRTAQLQAANEELEAFSYSVSHDLRAPLRHIGGYVEMLRSELEEVLNEDSRHYLETITAAAEHLGKLIDALLAFSRMGRSEMRLERVALGDLVNEARRELRGETHGRNVDWQIGRLPEVYVDPFMLRQALLNLLSNALKYTRTRAVARIEIRAETTSQEVIVSVHDNGVGFDMQYAHKLFGVFQRLHRSSEFEGTGIGLANVRRVIHRHGGRTWAESALDRGATFYFTIPHATVETL